LPYVLIGRHRRITRRAVQALISGTGTLTRDQLRSWWLSLAVAAELVRRPTEVVARAKENLNRLRSSSTRSAGRVWIEQWQQLLDGDLQRVLEALTSTSPRSRELRQNSPFSGILSESDRRAILDSFSQQLQRPAP
jgi:hypothetical protein